MSQISLPKPEWSAQNYFNQSKKDANKDKAPSEVLSSVKTSKHATISRVEPIQTQIMEEPYTTTIEPTPFIAPACPMAPTTIGTPSFPHTPHRKQVRGIIISQKYQPASTDKLHDALSPGESIRFIQDRTGHRRTSLSTSQLAPFDGSSPVREGENGVDIVPVRTVDVTPGSTKRRVRRAKPGAKSVMSHLTYCH